MKQKTIKSIIKNIPGHNVGGKIIRPVAHIWRHSFAFCELGIEKTICQCGDDITNAWSEWANKNIGVLTKFVPNIQTKAYLVLVDTNQFAINVFGKTVLFVNIDL